MCLTHSGALRWLKGHGSGRLQHIGVCRADRSGGMLQYHIRVAHVPHPWQVIVNER
jgi:hypothetical protein